MNERERADAPCTSVRNVISVEQANSVDVTAKLLAKGLKTAAGASPSVVVIVTVTGEDMASSLLAVTHFAHAASQAGGGKGGGGGGGGGNVFS